MKTLTTILCALGVLLFFNDVAQPATMAPNLKMNDLISLKSSHGKYLVAEADGRLNANRDQIGPWEKFRILDPNNIASTREVRYGDIISLHSDHGKYVVAEADGRANANRDAIGPWEKWTILDPNNPNSGSVIPDDGRIALKSFHGKYMVAEADHTVNANRDAIGPWEIWAIIKGSVSPPPPPPPPPSDNARFGVCGSPGLANDTPPMDLVKNLGVGWIRVAWYWPDMEPEKGKIDWEFAEKLVTRLKERKLKIYWDFSYAPGWSNGRGSNSNIDRAYPPKDQQDLFNFVYAVVSRFKGRVDAWGTWNEPNLSDYYQGLVNRYVTFEFETTLAAILRADPDATIVVGETSPLKDKDRTKGDKFLWLRAMLDKAKGRFDAISHHIYDDCPGDAVKQMDELRKKLRQWDYGKYPVWITETGKSDSEARKSAYLVCFYDKMKSRPWWGKTFWYRLEYESVSRYGLLDSQGQPNQTYYTYQNYIRGASTPPGSRTSVTIDLGDPDVGNGLTHVICCDGNTVPWPMGGRRCRANNAVTDHYFYFNISDSWAFQGNKPTLTFTINYFDKDTGNFSLQYDATSNAYKQGPSIKFTNTNTWKTVTWSVTDAYCGNRQNGGSDFRLAYFNGVDFYIDIVTITNP
jgi:hypothetical protein